MSDRDNKNSYKCFKINSPNVVCEAIDGEFVIVNLKTGHYYSLVNVGAHIFDLLMKGFPRAHVIEIIAGRYEGVRADMEKAVDDLIAQLQTEVIIVPREQLNREDLNSFPEAAELVAAKKPFQFPVLEKYTDVQDLLALDPIHEVDEMGWPNKKNQAVNAPG